MTRLRGQKTAAHRTQPKAAPQKVHDASPEAIIEMRGIVKRFSNAAGEFTVLKGIDLMIDRGEFVSIVGKSGSGKSTLLNMITGIDHPSEGQVIVNHNDIYTGVSESARSKWRGKNLGIVFQFFQLLPMLTLLDNIMLPMDFCQTYPLKERKSRALELLRLVEMEDHAYKLPAAISGGQQQRVAIARALANDPPILIADEPTGNLDSRTAEAVFQLFSSLIDQGKTIVMVTHDIAIARRVSRTLLIADGEVVNEWVAKAMPVLSHQQMLFAAKKARVLNFEPGQVIIQQDQPSENLYLISRGVAEVVLKGRGGSDVVVTRLLPGQYFGEIELLRDRQAIASVRAADLPLEVLALEETDFEQLLSESEAFREHITTLVSQREDENLQLRRKIK